MGYFCGAITCLHGEIAGLHSEIAWSDSVV